MNRAKSLKITFNKAIYNLLDFVRKAVKINFRKFKYFSTFAATKVFQKAGGIRTSPISTSKSCP